MIKKRRRKKRFKWLKKTKRWLQAILNLQKTDRVSFTRKKRRKKKRKYQPQSLSLQESLKRTLLLFKSPKPKRGRRKKSLSKRMHRRWLKFTDQVSQWNKPSSRTKKRRKRRRSKQYAVYVMSNQKKVD